MRRREFLRTAAAGAAGIVLAAPGAGRGAASAPMAAPARCVFSIQGEKTLLAGRPLLMTGLRCSNALLSDATTQDLVDHLPVYADYGCNTVSVYFMGSRFGDVKGYREDGSLDPACAARMGRIIEAAAPRGMVVLVGCLYWSTSKARWDGWTQKEADAAVANTVRWLKDRAYRNVFVDVDNEGMAHKAKAFDTASMVRAGKAADPACVIATNCREDATAEADLAIHHSPPVAGKPYAETEGSPPATPGGYWGSYSKKDGLYNYINIGVYTEAMKRSQIAATEAHLARGRGYLLASTWLQCPPPHGPNCRPGGLGGPDDPGIRWWLEYLKAKVGPYRPAV